MNYFENLKSTVLINSYTKNKGGVDLVGNMFANWFSEIGMSEERFVREKIGDHRLFKSALKDGKRVLLLGHLDTVFPEGSFEGYREDESWVYGPGVCDMKGGNIVALESLRRIYQKSQQIYNIDMLLVSDEESGSDDSKLLSSELAHEYDYCFVFEAAGENLEMVAGRKGVGTFTIDIKGKSAHAGNSYSSGVDANLEASHKLQELVALSDLSRGTTLNVGKIVGGIGANTVSPSAHLLFEIRYETSDERNRLLSSIGAIVENSFVDGTTATLGGGIQRDVMEVTQKSDMFVAAISNIVGQKIVTEKRGGVSDANIFASCGVVTLDGLGPFGDGDHTDKERALKSSFEKRIDLMEKILSYFMIHLKILKS